MQLAPVVKRGPQYTDESRAEIAGYLLQMRAGILKAGNSVERGIQLEIDIRGDKELVYWRNAEAVTRWLLYWIGYEVHRGKMYGEP